MKKYTNSAALALILMACIAIYPSISKAQSNGDDDSSNTPAFSDSGVTYSNNTNGGDDNQASNNTNGGDDNSNSENTNGGDDNQASNNTNGGDDNSNSQNTNGGDDTAPTAPVTPPATENNNRGGGGGSRSRRNTTVSPALPTLTSIANCSYINSFMNLNSQNDSAEVKKLQNFLKDIEKIDVDVNGIFDQKTFDAVKTFQTKYVSDILAPWGAVTPTGNVFYTTKKKINEIFCKSTFSLTTEQLAVIEAYKNSISNEIVDTENATGTDSVNPVVGSNASTTNLQAAAAFTSSIASKIWGFVKWLFGY